MNEALRLTHALRNCDTAVSSADALAGATGKIEVEGLVELLHAAPSAKAIAAAISALRQSHAEIIVDGLLHCLRDSRPSIRSVAIRELAVAHGTSVLTFNSTCYGRLLRAIKDSPLTPVDCYCYSLSQNAVTACWCAPTTLEQLDQNLQALESPELSLKRANLLRHFGDRVYEEDKVFHRLVRSR